MPERFAIVPVPLDESGRLFTGPANKLASYRYFGTEVLSVADGVVVGTHDGPRERSRSPAGRRHAAERWR
ncbi:MAG TPA: hypothetical protein VKP64_11040 [Mycobacteriales bacterium]|nr:hypothetical protein [Mycobacteriales bacterium]